MSGSDPSEIWLHPLSYASGLLKALIDAGWSTIFVDLERHDLSDEEIGLALQAIRENGGDIVMRCASPSVSDATRCVAADGLRVVVPMIESVAQFATIVDGTGREDVEFIPLVETAAALADIAAIAALDRVRTIMFGPYDLSAEQGFGPWPNVLPQLLPLLMPAFEIVRKQGKKVGFHVLTDWENVIPLDSIDVISCSIDDVGRRSRTGFPARYS
jgi:2-keto-3-deoxy-L-rhamnonate aldolase RhmA